MVDGNRTASRGSSFEFALELMKQLCGADEADTVAGPMVMPLAHA
jgi:hypothetical protein